MKKADYKTLSLDIANDYEKTLCPQFNLESYINRTDINSITILKLQKYLAELGYSITVTESPQNAFICKICKTELRKKYEEIKKLHNKEGKGKTGPKPIDDEKIVSLIYELYTDKKGLSLNWIAEYLNNNGYKPIRGKKWYKSTISNILKNETYLKLGIIDSETFTKAQNILSLNKRR